VCARVDNQWSRDVVIARVQTDAVQSLRHKHRDLYQSTYPICLERSGLILLSYTEVVYPPPHSPIFFGRRDFIS
jgi:hypothetical protein